MRRLDERSQQAVLGCVLATGPQERVMHDLWRTEPPGILSAEVNGLRLIVQTPEKVSGLVRFMVLRRDTFKGQDVLIGSGSEETVRGAMTAAERLAGTFSGS